MQENDALYEAYRRLYELAPAFYSVSRRRMCRTLTLAFLSVLGYSVVVLQEAYIWIAFAFMIVGTVVVVKCIPAVSDCLFFGKMCAGKVSFEDAQGKWNWEAMLQRVEKLLAKEGY